MIGKIKSFLGIKSPSLKNKERWDNFSSNFFDGFNNGINGEPSKSTPEQQKEAWESIERMARIPLLLDADNYEEYP